MKTRSKVIIGFAVFVLVIALVGYVYNSIRLAEGNLGQQVNAKSYTPTATIEDVPKDWKDYKHGNYYEVKYPAAWSIEQGPQETRFIIENNSGIDQVVVSISDAFPSGSGMWRKSEAGREVVTIGFTTYRSGDIAYNVTLHERTAENLRVFELMLASFKFIQSE